MKKKPTILYVFILIYSLAGFYFYSPVNISISILKAISWLLIAFCFALSFKEFFFLKAKESTFFYLFKGVIFMLFFSIITANYSWNQPFLLTLKSTMPYFMFFLFFFFWKFKPEINKLENIIWFLCICYLLCYFYALSKAPTPVFGNSEREINDERGFLRLFVPGRSFLYLAYFLALARYSKLKTKYWLFISIGLFVVIVMHVIRQYILFSFLIGVYVILKEINWLKKISLVLLVLFLFSYAYEKNQVLKNLVDLSEGQISNNSSKNEDIRIKSLRYFFTEFSPNTTSFLFGNGVPHVDSSYGKFYKGNLNEKGIYMSDVGYAQIFAIFGVTGLIVFSVLFYKGIRKKKVPLEYKYTQWYIVYVVLSNISSGFVLNNSTILTIVFVFYILDTFAFTNNKSSNEIQYNNIYRRT